MTRIVDFLFEPELCAAFVDLPRKLHAKDPFFTAPIRASALAQFSPHNPFLQHGEARAFLAYGPSDEPIARVAAMIDRRLTEGGGPLGLVGFFDAPDDLSVATTLLDAAATWLRSQGAKHMWGPVEFSIFNRYRFKTKGLELEPFLGEPHNPAYYPQLFERYGFRVREASASWDLSEEHLAQICSALRAAARERDVHAAGYGYRSFDSENFDADFRAFYELTIEGFREHTGYVPITFEEFSFWNSGARLFLDPNMVVFMVAPDGSLCGSGYAYPDYGRLVRALDGDASLERVLTLRPRHPPSQIIFHTGMIRKEHRLHGLVPGGFLHLARGGEKAGLKHGIGAFAKLGVNSLFERLYSVAPRTREYALYEKAL